MSNNIKKIFFFISVTGWILGLIGHIQAITGHVSNAFMILHFGIFIVWLPAVLCLKKEAGNSIPEFFNYFKAMPAPVWLKIIAIACFVYAIVNFLLFMAPFQASPENDPDIIRGFSGHWMAFYGMAALILYPFGQKKNKKDTETTYMKNYK